MVTDINNLTKEELIKVFLKNQKHFTDKVNELQEKVKELEKQHESDLANINNLDLRLKVAEEKYRQVINAKYQSQRNNVNVNQLSLFDDFEEEVLKTEEQESEAVITVAEHTKRKPKKKEEHIDYSSLEHKVTTIEPTEEELLCDKCGSRMTISRYEEKKELIYVPSQVYVKVTRIPVLQCVNCETVNEEGKTTYKLAPHPNKLFDRSMASPSILAYILDLKYNRGLPLYEIEKMFKQNNCIIPRATMCNWVLSSKKYLQPLYDLMKEDMLSRRVLCADETRTQVLKEENKLATSTSYMFVYRTVRGDGGNIIIYDYQPSRSGDSPKEFLNGFHGVLMTDAYGGYNKVEGITRCMCNIHALRKFKDAYKLLPNDAKTREGSDEAISVKKYDAIFHQENLIKSKANELGLKGEKREQYILKRRQKEVKPLFDELLAWLNKISARNAGKYGMNSAINYTLNNQKELQEFLNYGFAPISNQETEQSIRPFIYIRNRCKFYVSPRGATVSAMIYSLVISAIENRRQPYTYFMYVFEKLKDMDLTDKEALRGLLPYSSSLPDYTRILSKKNTKNLKAE